MTQNKKLFVTLTVNEYTARSLADDTLKDLLGDEALKSVKQLLKDDERNQAEQKIRDAKEALRRAQEQVLEIQKKHRDG